MADRMRKPAEETKADLDKLFLEKSRVKETMSDVLAKLTANRPKDALQFIADYFQSTFEQSKRLDKCYRCIMMTHHSRPVYQQNIASAFDILNQSKLGKGLYGVTGSIFDELITLILQGTPESHIKKMTDRLSRRRYEAVTYHVFHYAVTILAVYKDYLRVAEDLFELLDVNSSGQVDKVYADLLLTQLSTTFDHFKKDCHSGIQAGISLSPDALHTTVSKVSRNATGKEFIDCKHFLELSADVYLSLLQPPD
ncbi:tubulin polyglutamylase complex subunit 1-like [Watersipora subatra]|uniref:tubulin polyglutamylase complex subunit 1-like n=1 Tax=Watersipora subatra TaxID=2589382 RepID=UPI00355C2FD0